MGQKVRSGAIFFLLFIGFFAFGKDPYDLERLEFENARDIALRTLQLYPAEKYNFVGIGRSVTPVITVLREILPDSVFTLPLSNMYYRPQYHEGYQAPLSEDAERRLFDHFQRFLPLKEQNRGKEVLFLDFVIGGGSAVATEEYLAKFFKDRRPDIKSKMLIFSPLINPDKIAEAGKDYDVISTRNYDVLNQRWMFSWFDGRAEYGRFSYPFEGSDLLKPNLGRERAEFLKHYRNYIKSDVKLARFLDGCKSTLRKLAAKKGP